MEEKKAMVALLGFIFATLEIGFDKKKVFLMEEVKYIYIYTVYAFRKTHLRNL